MINLGHYYNVFPQQYIGEWKDRNKGGSQGLLTMQSSKGMTAYKLVNNDGKTIVHVWYGGKEGQKAYTPICL